MEKEELQQDITYKKVLPKKYAAMLGDKLKREYKVTTSCTSIFGEQLTSSNPNSFSSNYTLSPSLDQAISDYMIEEIGYCVKVSFNNTSGGPVRPFNANSFTVLPYANYGTCSQLTTIIGNASCTIQQSKILPLLQFNNPTAGLNIDFTSPCNRNVFTDLNGIDAAETTYKVNCLKNVFSNYSSATYGNGMNFSSIEFLPLKDGSANFGFDNTAVANNTTVDREISFRLRTPVWNGLNSLTNEDAGCFTGITNFQLSRQVVSNIALRLIQIRPPTGLTITGISVTPYDTPKLYYNIYNFNNSIPRPLKNYLIGHDYSNLQVQSASVNIAGYEQNKSLTFNSITLNSVPSAVYLYVGLDYDNIVTTVPVFPVTTNTYLENSDVPGFQITNILITYGGQSIISNMTTPYQVYNELSASEGFMVPFCETGYTINNSPGDAQPTNAGARKMGMYGSVLRVDVSKLNLDWSKFSNGSSKSTQFGATIQVNNLSRRARTAVIYCQPVYDRLYMIDSGNVTSTYSIVNEEIMESLKNTNFTISPNNNGVLGGRLLAGAWYNNWGDLWNDVVKPVGKFAWDNKDTIAKLVGLGKKPMHKGKGINEDEELESIDYMGGKVISKSEIKKKLKFI